MLRMNEMNCFQDQAGKGNLDSQLRREAKKIRAGKVVLSTETEVEWNIKRKRKLMVRSWMIGTGLKD